MPDPDPYPQPDPVEAWIQDREDPAEARALVAFATHLNTWDEGLRELLAPDVEHDSQARWEPICGAEPVAAFFLDPRRRESGAPIAELAVGPPGLPRVGACVLLHVRDSGVGLLGLGTPRSMITVRLDEAGRIAKTFSCCLVPNPAHASRSGLFPGFTADELESERVRVGRVLEDPSEVELFLFLLPALEARVAAYRTILDTWASDRGLGPVRLGLTGPDGALGRALGALAHPTVVLTEAGSRVRLIEGFRSEERLRALLDEALVGALWLG